MNVADAVAKVCEGLSSEGMGDLGELVRAAGTTSTGGNVVTLEVERRTAFRRRIFLPRILAREGDDWRLFDYESDLFPQVDWEALEWSKAAEFSPDDASSLAHTRVAVDVDQLGPDPKKPLGVAEAGAKPDLDFPVLARLLADVIPNPWQAARILRGALAVLRARDFTEDQLPRFHQRPVLFQQIPLGAGPILRRPDRQHLPLGFGHCLLRPLHAENPHAGGNMPIIASMIVPWWRPLRRTSWCALTTRGNSSQLAIFIPRSRCQLRRKVVAQLHRQKGAVDFRKTDAKTLNRATFSIPGDSGGRAGRDHENGKLSSRFAPNPTKTAPRR